MLADALSYIFETLISINSKTYNCNVPKMTIDFDACFVPAISIKDYLCRILTLSMCHESCMILSLIFVDRLIAAKKIIISIYNIHRIIFTCLVVAVKSSEDTYYSNAFYAKVGGISIKELSILEIELLKMIDYRLFVKPTLFFEYYDKIKCHRFVTNCSINSLCLQQPACTHDGHNDSGNINGFCVLFNTNFTNGDYHHYPTHQDNYQHQRVHEDQNNNSLIYQHSGHEHQQYFANVFPIPHVYNMLYSHRYNSHDVGDKAVSSREHHGLVDVAPPVYPMQPSITDNLWQLDPNFIPDLLRPHHALTSSSNSSDFSEFSDYATYESYASYNYHEVLGGTGPGTPTTIHKVHFSSALYSHIPAHPRPFTPSPSSVTQSTEGYYSVNYDESNHYGGGASCVGFKGETGAICAFNDELYMAKYHMGGAIDDVSKRIPFPQIDVECANA